MLKLFANHDNGDTIVEVLFAITIFSLVAVGAMSIMNQGTMTVQRALEITLVRNEIDAQAEALRFLHESYIAAPSTNSEWYKIINGKTVQQATNLGDCSILPKFFVINTRGGDSGNSGGKISNVVPVGLASGTYSQLKYDNSSNTLVSADGIWIEAVKDNSASGQNINLGSKYIDFHVRACWNAPGQSTPITLGTIVRLYDPSL
jgi:type II secretory pathway pseudopilin PulG